MIVFSQADPNQHSRANDSVALTLAAREEGLTVYRLPLEKEGVSGLDDTFARIPRLESERPGVWVGYVPGFDFYRFVYERALAKNIRLLNSPEEHRLVFEFDRAYPHLDGLTPKTRVVASVEECRSALEALGLPVFIKGALFSRKGSGWKACVAETLEEAETLTREVLGDATASRGRVLLRSLAPLRREYVEERAFYVAREFRVFLYRRECVAFGYYWPYVHAWGRLDDREREDVISLARRAAERLESPYICLDIGQQEDGSWIVIETNDPQFCGLGWIDPSKVWEELARLVER
jgi:hypothetical protein